MQNEHHFIHKQANDWLIKLETGAMADGDEERFIEWLEKDQLHGEIFYAAEEAWKLMHQVDPDDISESKVQDSPHKASNWASRYLLPMAATVLFSLTSMIWWQDAYYITSSDYYTLTGDRESVTLTDGSVITLNTDSAIDVEFDQRKRLIELLNGEINVQVAPNQNRPFIVKAGEMHVTALGTAFIVRKHSDAPPTVTVTEHSVNVEASDPTTRPVTLQEGEQISLLEKQDSFTSVKTIDPSEESAWLDGKYVFFDKSLEEVIKELSRYYEGRIVIRDETLNKMRITGVLDIDDPITSLQSLAESLPIKVTTLTPYLTFIDRK